jgi:spermidine synthase
VRRLVEEVLREDPDNVEALVTQALVSQAEGRNTEAVNSLRRATQLAPDQPLAYPVMARILMKEHRNGEAIDAFRQGLRIAPAAPGDHANLGRLLEQTGRTEEAIVQLQNALRWLPDHQAFRADLAWLLATTANSQFRDPEQALRLAEEACAATEYRDAACLESLAAAQAAQGRYTDAVKTAQRAGEVARDTGQPERLARIQEQIRSYEHGQPYGGVTGLHDAPYPVMFPKAFTD